VSGGVGIAGSLIDMHQLNPRAAPESRFVDESRCKDVV
jgi:hypothetical protein